MGASSTARRWVACAIGALLLQVGCAGDGARQATIPGGHHLVQKGEYQALYDRDGRMVRLVQDRNRDGHAEVVITFYPNRRPRQGEMDTDGDGRVDRWEVFLPDGRLEKVGVSRAANGRPDAWEYR